MPAMREIVVALALVVAEACAIARPHARHARIWTPSWIRPKVRKKLNDLPFFTKHLDDDNHSFILGGFKSMGDKDKSGREEDWLGQTAELDTRETESAKKIIIEILEKGQIDLKRAGLIAYLLDPLASDGNCGCIGRCDCRSKCPCAPKENSHKWESHKLKK